MDFEPLVVPRPAAGRLVDAPFERDPVPVLISEDAYFGVEDTPLPAVGDRDLELESILPKEPGEQLELLIERFVI